MLRCGLPARHAVVALLPVLLLLLLLLLLLPAERLSSQRMEVPSICHSYHVCAGSGRRLRAAAARASATKCVRTLLMQSNCRRLVNARDGRLAGRHEGVLH